MDIWACRSTTNTQHRTNPVGFSTSREAAYTANQADQPLPSEVPFGTVGLKWDGSEAISVFPLVMKCWLPTITDVLITLSEAIFTGHPNMVLTML